MITNPKNPASGGQRSGAGPAEPPAWVVENRKRYEHLIDEILMNQRAGLPEHDYQHLLVELDWLDEDYAFGWLGG